MPTKIQRLIDDRVLETIQAADADVAALWEKAVRSAQDSRNPQNSADNQYVLGYQGLLQRRTAILAEQIRQRRKVSAYLPGSPTPEARPRIPFAPVP